MHFVGDVIGLRSVLGWMSRDLSYLGEKESPTDATYIT